MLELEKLKAVLQKKGPLAIAVSGGVDSMTLAYLACKIEPLSEVFHAVSAAVPQAATQRVKDYAKKYHWQLKCIDAGEMSDQNYLKNPVNRCYYCKNALYSSLQKHSPKLLASGTNCDDLSDFRPGLKAAELYKVCHPFLEANLYKRDVRRLASELGLQQLAELPASPCLSSRVFSGVGIREDMLRLIDKVETQLGKRYAQVLQPTTLRCRIADQEVVLEFDDQAWQRLHELQLEEEVCHFVRSYFLLAGLAARAEKIDVQKYQQGHAFVHAAE